jgi:hypothetical protein
MFLDNFSITVQNNQFYLFIVKVKSWTNFNKQLSNLLLFVSLLNQLLQDSMYVLFERFLFI